MQRLYSCVLILILCTSCIKQVDGLIEHQTGKYFLQSIVAHDSIITAYIGSIGSVFGEKVPRIDDAIILVSENEILIDTLRSLGEGKYRGFKKAHIGKRYKLWVPNYNNIQSIETLIPDSTSMQKAVLKYPTGYYAPDQEFYGTLNIEFNDNPTTENFYELFFYKIDTVNGIRFNYSFFQDPYYYIRFDNIIKSEGDRDFNPMSVFFSDKLFNGQRANIEMDIKMYQNITLQLRSISKEYYLYRKFYTRHAFNSDINLESNIQNMLFIGEPIDMYSNVIGGLGVVASYSSTTKIIELK